MSLTAPQLGEQLDRLRGPVLESKRREFPRLPLEDLQDIYGQAVEGVLRSRMEFDGEAQLAAYLHRAVGNLARNVTRSGAQRTVALSDDLGELPLADRSLPDPDDLVLGGQARTVLWEFLAELPSERDRTIAYLHHDPAHALAPRQIARELDLPYQDVCSILKRTTVKLSRFAAQLARPGAFCHRRRGDVIEWQRTGIVPLPLRIHMGHCHHCRAQHQGATVAARRAILPLLPVSGAPLAGVSLVSRVHQAVAAHPLTQRVDGALGRWRKVAPVGGGGGAAIAAKLAAAGAIVAVGAASAALHAVIVSHPPSHVHHRRAVVHAAIQGPSAPARAAAVMPMPYTTPAATTTTPRTATTSTAASTTTTARVMPPAPNASLSLVRREEQTGNAPPAPNESTSPSTETKAASSSNSSSSAATSSTADSRSTSAISGPPAPGAPPPP